MKYKFIVNLILLPYHLLVFRKGWQILTEDFPKRKAFLIEMNNKNPTLIEYFMGICCVICLIANCYYKYFTRSLIFMFNPCHIVNFFLIFICFSRHSRLGEICALGVYAFAHGGWIGIIFSEN